MKKIVSMTGSFNPVTIAHFKVLSDAVKKLDADEGVFITTNDQYLTAKCLLKVKTPTNFILSGKIRSEMINSLKSDDPKLSHWGSELGGTNPGTFRTLKKLIKDKQKQYPGEEIKLYYLFGADKLRNVSHWVDADKMIETCEYVVYSRMIDVEKTIQNDSFLISHRDRIHSLKVDDDDLDDVSSTEVRRRFFSGEDYRSLMNEGPYRILGTMSPSDFPPVTPEDLIQANILYGGRFGGNAANLLVFKENQKTFSSWSDPRLGDPISHRSAIVYKDQFKVDVPEKESPTITGCVNDDCVNVAEEMIKDGLSPAILNPASRITPGGGYNKGISAREESLCRSSTLSQSLFNFGNPRFKHIREFGVRTDPGVYPLDINFGGIYSPCVTFFRRGADDYFALRNDPFDCPVISVASPANWEANDYCVDESAYFTGDGSLTDEGREIEKNKIRTIFRIGLQNGRDSLVLGDFGCGVYYLRPEEVAELFREVLLEPEFKNRFKKVIFAIDEGEPTSRRPDKGPNGKFKPFYDIFG